MNYFYSSVGNIFTIYGCSDYLYRRIVFVKYKSGDTVFLREKALKGITEKIVIKKVRLFQKKPIENFCDECSEPTISPLYIDTLNAYHNERDLITYAEALSLIERFEINRNSQLEITNCIRKSV